MTTTNPWRAVHEEDDLAFTGDGYSPAMSRVGTAAEYEGMDEAHICGKCGSPRAFWRATVGAVMCTACSAVRRVRAGEDGQAKITWL